MQEPLRCAIRVVSLVEATARRARVTADLAGFPHPWTFLDGCRADTPSVATPAPEAQIARFGRVLTGGEIGCFKSHLQALESFDAPGAPDWLLVLEDDVWIDPDLDLAGLIAVLEAEEIGYLRLFQRTHVPGWPVIQLGPRQIVYLATDPYGTQAYLISRRAAARFRRHLARTGNRIVRPVDDEFGRFWEHGLEIFALVPSPAVERTAPSVLEGDRQVSAGTRPAKGAHRWSHQIGDAMAKRLWLWRRLLALTGDGLSGKARPLVPPLRWILQGPRVRG